MAEFLEDNQEQGTPPLPSGYTAIKKNDSTVPPLPSGYELKKKEQSQSTIPTENTESVQKDGSLGGPKFRLAGSKEVLPKKEPKETLYDLNGNTSQVNKKAVQKIKAQTPVYTGEKGKLFISKEEADKIDNDITQKIFSVDENKLESSLQSEKDDNEVSDYLREGGKNALNVLGGIANIVPKAVNAMSGGNLALPAYEPFEKKVPFEKATKAVNEDIKEAKKQNPNFKLSADQFDQAVKEKFKEQAKKEQYKENALKVLADKNPLIQERIKGNIVDGIKNLDDDAKANAVQIQVLDNKATPLRKELLETKKLIDSGKADANTIEDYKSKLANYNDLEKQYFELISEQEKNKSSKLSADERLELFKLNYNPYGKAIDDLIYPTQKMIGEGIYAIGKVDDFVADITGGGDESKTKYSGITELGNKMIESSEKALSRHPNVAFTDIDGFGKLGSWMAKTTGNVAPFILGTAIGTTEEQMVSKAFLTPSKALGGFSTTSAGSAMHEMDKEMLENPNINYNNWQYAGKVLGNVASNAVMFGNYGTMLKGNKALFESISKAPEANVAFQKGVKDYLSKSLGVAKGLNKSGSLMMGSTAINMFVDNHILGKKHENGFDELVDSYIEGVAMHGLISELPNLGVYMLEKVVPNRTKIEINKNLAKSYGLAKEMENPNLTIDEKAKIQTQINEVHKANEKLLKSSVKQVKGFTHNQVKELLVIDQDKFEITKQAEEIKKGNYSREYKENALKELKTKFDGLENRRQDVFENEHNALTLLPKSEQNRLEKEAKIKIAEKLGKEVADVKNFDQKEINETALRIHKTELKENEQTAKTETPEQIESQPKAEVQENVQETTAVENAEPVQESKEAEAKEVMPLKKLEQDYNDKTVDELVAIKKELYPNPDIESAMTPEEKLLDKVIAKKFSDKNAEIKAKRNESTKQTEANPNNGVMGVGAESVAENPIAESKNIEPKSVSETANGGGSEKPNEVRKVKSAKGATYDVHFDENGNITKVISPKDGREIKQFTEVKTKNKLGQEVTKLRKNPNYSQIEADALGFTTENKIKTEDKKSFEKALDDFTPTNEYEVALEALARGTKVNREAITKELGNNDSTKWATDKNGASIEALAEQLMEGNENLDEGAIRGHLIDIISSHSNLSEVKDTFLNSFSEKEFANQEKEMRAYLDGLSEKDFAMYEATKAEDEYLSELSDKEVEDYYNQKLNEYEQSNTETTNEKPSDITESNEGQKAEKQPTRQERIAERVNATNAKIEDIANDLKGIESLFGIKIKADFGDSKINGTSKDDLIDFVASVAKQISETGIKIDEAIKTVIDEIAKKYDVDFTEKDVLDKHFAEKVEEPIITDKEGNEYTSLKKAVYDAEREAQGKEVINTTNKKSPTQVRNEVEAKIASGEITEQEIRDIATAIVNESDIPTKLSGEEIEYALLHDKVTLEKEERRIDSELKTAIADKDYEKQAQLMVDKAQNQILGDLNYEASKKTGSEASRIMHAKKAGLDEDYSYRTVLDRVKEMSKKEDVPEQTKAVLKKMTQDITDLQTKIDDYENRFKQHEAEVKKLEEEKAELEEKISKTQGEEKLEKIKQLKTNKEYKKAEIDRKKKETIDAIREKYKKLSGTLNAGVNLKLLELAPEIAGLAKLYVIDEPAIQLEELIGRMLIELQDAIPDITERDLRDLFSGYGKQVKPKEDKVAESLSKLKSKARALSGLEDVREENIAPLRSGYNHRPPTPEVLAIRKEIQREMRERGIDISKSKNPEDAWKTALEAYKTRINNRIEYLENIEKTQNTEKFLKDKKKTKLKLDDEARDLKKKQQLIKNKVDDMVAKADFETWNKWRKAGHFGLRYAKGNLISAPATLIKIIGAVGWRLAYKPIHATSMYGASKLFPKLAETQGINSRKDLADHLVDYYKTAFSKRNYKDFIQTFKQHNSNEDILFGKHYAEVPLPKVRGNEDLNIAQKVFFGHLKFLEDLNASSHGAMKNLVSLPEYTAWKNTILRNLIKEGIPTELLENGNAEQIAHQLAYLKGLRAKFMQKNQIAEMQSAKVAQLRNKGMQGTANVVEFLLPIVKIGSNYVGESLEKQPGVGLIPNVANITKARESLTEKQKSDLLRTLSYQGVGMASFLAGAMLYQNISPFYGTDSQKHAKKNGKDLPEEDESIGKLEGVFTHAPDAVNMRAGATFMWYWDKLDKMNGTKNSKQSMMNFMGAIMNREILTGIVSQSPYITASEGTVGPILNPKSDLGKAGANTLRSRIPFGDMTKTLAEGHIPFFNKIMPETSDNFAKNIGMHPEEVKPSEIEVYPKGLGNNIMLGIPGWREDVLKEAYDEKYGVKKMKSDIKEEIEKELRGNEKEVKKQKFRKGLSE